LDLTNKELIDLIKNNVDTMNNLERLYKQNTGFINHVVRNRRYDIYEIDDLFQEAYIALVKAVELFDDKREDFSFLTMFKWCILNRIRNLDGTIPSRLKGLIVKFKRIRDNITKDLGYEPTDDEMMEKMGIDYEKLIRIKQNLYSSVPLDDFLYGDGKTTKLDVLVDENAHLIAQYNLENEDMKNKVHGNISMLTYEMQDVLKFVYIEEKPYIDIAAEMGITSSKVVSIEKRALRYLRQNKRFLNDVIDYVKDDDINFYSNKSAEDIAIQKIYEDSKLKF